MKKLLLSFLLFIACFRLQAQIGEFASAIYISVNGTGNFYNTTGSGANMIDLTHNFTGDLGTFTQNCGMLKISGAELKTYRGNNDNVCGGTLYYRIYPTGSPSGSFSSISIPWKCNCGGSTFNDGYGPCSGNDQKWSTTTANVDLTTLSGGNYTLEIYYQYTGDVGSTTTCNTTNYINNGGSNFTATFTIDAASPCAMATSEASVSKSSNLVYPNPASSKIYISNSIKSSNIAYKIMDASGRLIKSGKYNNEISISDLKAGLYNVQIIVDGAIYSASKVLKN